MRVVVGLVVLVGCAGCRVTVPGDGRLVEVRVDKAIALHQVQLFTGRDTSTVGVLGDSVRAGCRYWDAVGARLRTTDEIGDELPVAVLHVEQADAVTSAFADGRPAWFGYTDGAIHVTMDGYYDRGFAETYASLFAHEIGHALGLDHVEAGAVMHPGESWPRLQRSDVEQFAYVTAE